MATTVYTNAGRTFNLSQVTEMLDEGSSSYVYLFIGDVPVAQTAGDDGSLDTALTFEDTFQNDFDVWSRIVGMKRLTASDVAYVVPRNDWTTGTVYVPYRINLDSPADSYVLTSQNTVHLCIDNNEGAQSTSEPTSTGTTLETTADGYVWKYLYTIPSSAQDRFLTADWMPVFTDTTVADAAVDGSVHYLVIDSPGSYTVSGEFTVSIVGDGTGFSGLANVSTLNGYEEYGVTYLTVVDPGSGYRLLHPTANVELSMTEANTNTAATISVVLEPPSGIGANNKVLLQSKELMFNVNLIGDEAANGIPVLYLSDPETDLNAYRMIGLIASPIDVRTDSPARVRCYNGCHVLDYTGATVTGTVESGTVMYQYNPSTEANVSFRVLYNDTTNNLLFVTRFSDWQNLDLLTTGLPIIEKYVGSSNVSTVVHITAPNVSFGSGEILYKSSLTTPLTRAAAQTETFRVIVSFDN